MKYTIHANALSAVQKQTAAMLVATMLMWAIGAPLLMVNRANAAQLLFVSDTISDSDKGVLANHTIRFTTSATGQLTAGESIIIDFDDAFDTPATLNYENFDMTVGGVDQTLAAAPSGASWGVTVNDATDTYTITSGTGTIGTSTQVVIEIGTNASFGAVSTRQLTNPNPATAGGIGTSYPVTISGSMDDSGVTRVAIIDDVTMTASVDTRLTFNIYGVASSTVINGTDATYATSTATSMAFGTLTPGEPKVLGQRLTVATNARNGYSVTVVQDQNLLSASTADIDLFYLGDATSTPVGWLPPTDDMADEKTWGHYGITSEDSTLSWGGGDPFGSALFAGNFASTSPLEVLYNTGPSDGLVAGTGSTTIAVKIEIGNLQEAANDYTNTLTYVCTPIF
jgi:hypothetical protein